MGFSDRLSLCDCNWDRMKIKNLLSVGVLLHALRDNEVTSREASASVQTFYIKLAGHY